MQTTVLGYPRIGGGRELKRAVEGYWAGQVEAGQLAEVGATIRRQTWTTLDAAGLGSVPSNTFSYYDHVLDAAVLVDAVPERFRALGLSPLDEYFAMARGTGAVSPLELTKWFDTNYHYLVPEIGPETRFAARPGKPVAELAESAALGVPTRPVLVGPVTLLLLAKPPAASGRSAAEPAVKRLGQASQLHCRKEDPGGGLTAAGVGRVASVAQPGDAGVHVPRGVGTVSRERPDVGVSGLPGRAPYGPTEGRYEGRAGPPAS